MDFKISARHMDLTDSIREYAREKSRRLHRYFDRIQEISTVIDKHDLDFEVEILVDVERHKPFVGTKRGDDLYACIDAVVDKLERQLTDHKEKLRNRKHSA